MSLLQKRGRRFSLGLNHWTVRFQPSQVFSVLISSVSFVVHSPLLSHFNSFSYFSWKSVSHSLSFPCGFQFNRRWQRCQIKYRYSFMFTMSQSLNLQFKNSECLIHREPFSAKNANATRSVCR